MTLSIGGASLSSASDWTGWLGPQRNGRVEDFIAPDVWPEELTREWTVEVGIGYGTPIVVGDQVFQHARQGEEEVVWRLDLETGEERWRKSYPALFEVGGGAEFHGPGPKACPAYADGRIFTLSISGLLSAWGADTGDLLWQHDPSKDYDTTHPYWGATGSPLIDGERVVVHFGNDERGSLVALDAASGDVVWSHGSDGASYASPILVEIDGVRQIVELNNRAIVGVEAESGEYLWEYPYPQVTTDQNMITPVFYEGLVIQGGENRGVLCLEPRQTDGQWSAELVWQQDEVALDMSTAVINDGLLYGMSHYNFGRLFCLDPRTGELRWLGPVRLGENVAFLATGDYVAALINKGELQFIAPDKAEPRIVASFTVSESETWAPPVLLRDRILIKDHDHLTLWTLAAPEE